MIRLAVFLVLLASGAAAQSITELRGCMPFERAVRILENSYREAQVFNGIDGQRRLAYELWVNVDTGSWTIIRLHRDGRACILVSGMRGALVHPMFSGEGT